MTHLNEIPGILDESLQLLQAAGVGSAEELAMQDADLLVAELKRANAVLSISKRAPGKPTVSKWIAGAKKLTGESAAPEAATPEVIAPEVVRLAVAAPVNYEANADVAEMLSRAPCAIPLPGKIMMEKGLRVADVPAGLLLNRYSGDLEVRIIDHAAPKTEVPSRRRNGHVESVTRQQATSRHFEASSPKSLVSSFEGGKRKPSSKSGHEENRVALIRAPREETNRGKDPESRRYVRGVLHTHPWSLRIGAIFSLLIIINCPLAILSGFLLLASRESPGKFEWVAEWILAFPIALPLTGLGYLIWGMNGKCRICTQKLFVHRNALKHVKAHRFPGIGFVVPLCLHLLAFHWFRCSSCGTPVRLKK